MDARRVGLKGRPHANGQRKGQTVMDGEGSGNGEGERENGMRKRTGRKKEGQGLEQYRQGQGAGLEERENAIVQISETIEGEAMGRDWE